MSKALGALLLFCAGIVAGAQSLTTVTASNVQVDNGSGTAVNPPAGSSLCFTGVNNAGATITYTPSGGAPTTGPVCQTLTSGGALTGSLQIGNPATASPNGLHYTITVINGSTTYLTVPTVSLSGTLFNYDTFALPGSGTASGIGAAHLACAIGARWTSTTFPAGSNSQGCNFAGQWQGYPPNPYCPTGTSYHVPQMGGAPFCLPPVISGIGSPSGVCVNTSFYLQQDATAGQNQWACINSAWVHQTGSGSSTSPGGTPGNIQGNFAGSFGGAGTLDLLGNLGANVNSQQNVMMSGAKGDCSTDDHDAIEKASVAAWNLSVGAALPAVVYFPKPPGGCYLTSTLQYIGVPFVGQPSGDGVSTVQYGVTLKGQPGYDVLHVPDPMTGAGALTFTNGSAVISATNGYAAGSMVLLATTGGLPTNFATKTIYYVSATGLSVSQFELATTTGGTPIVAGSAGSGTQTATYPWNLSWLIQDVSLVVNNSVLPTTTTVPSMLHRWPGRWVDDGAITASSTTFTSSHGSIGCADVGQQILVGGAGATAVTSTLGAAISSTSQTVITLGAATTSSWPTIFGYVQVDSEIMMYVGTQANGLTSLTVLRGQAGTTAATHSNGATMTVLGNLATTISAVSPCWGNANGGASTWKKITLGAAATTTVSSAHFYVSILDLPVATNIGNCGFAFDNIDAKAADFPNPAQLFGSNHSKLLNVNFNSTNGAPVLNNHCGFFAEGTGNTLTTHESDHVNFYALDFGLVESQSEINSFNSSGGDFQTWEHMQFFVDRQPWISYNGGEGVFKDAQLTTLSGPQFMTVGNSSADVAGWTIDIREFESWGIPGDTRFGLRVEGTGYTIDGEVGISADSTNAAWIDSLISTCNCFVGSAAPIHLFGAGNALTGTVESATIDNQGKGNSAWGFNNGSGYPGGQPYPAPVTLVPVKGMPGYLGGSEPDFAADGYPATPYRHEDLFLWPSDLLIGTAGTDLWTTIHQYDTAAPITGEKLLFKAGGGTASFQPAYLANPLGSPTGAFTIGTNFPAAKGTLYVSLEGANSNTTTSFCLNATNSNCLSITLSTSAFATYAIPFDFTSATGNITIKNNGAATHDVWLAWAYIDIAPQLPAGSTIGGLTPLTANPTGKTTWTLGTTAIPANTCSLQTSVTLSGVTTSSAISWQPSADYTAVTGFSPAGTTIYFYAWPTSNTIHWYACNASASPVTPGGSTTWNVGVTF